MSHKSQYPEEIKSKHVKQAAKKWKTEGGYKNFRNSIRYDVIIDNAPYPPKAICSIAHELATSIPLNSEDFGGSKEGIWHKCLKELGFEIRPKSGNAQKTRPNKDRNLWVDPSEEEIHVEGKSITVSVNRYERDRKARKKCIEQLGVKCSICGFKFEDIYGDIGKGFIHIHHIIPLSKTGRNYVVNPIKDLIPVCPNCHAMLHRANINPMNLRKILKANKRL